MSYGFEFLINGLVSGTVYALLAAGFSLIFGAGRLINFAHGSVYMAGAYIAWFVSSRLGLPLFLAIPTVLLVGALLGLLIDFIAVGPFAGRSTIAPLLASLGLGMVIDSSLELIFGVNPLSFPPLLPTERFVLAGVNLGASDLLIVGSALCIALGLFLFIKCTRLGRAIRSAAQDAEAASLMGVNVVANRRLVMAIASAIGALAGLLIGVHYNQITNAMGLEASLKGFIASMAGGLTSIPASVAGGFLLGILESFGVATFGSAAKQLVAFVILLLIVFLRPQGLFIRKVPIEKEVLTGSFLPNSRRITIPWYLWIFGLGIAIALPLIYPDPYLLQLGANIFIYILAATALTLLAGTSGIVSLGHGGLMSIGAYAYALLALRFGWPFLPALGGAIIISSVLGTVLISPALRLHGHAISIATLILSEIISQIILNADSLTQGAMGIAGVPFPVIGSWQVVSALDFYWLFLIILIVIGTGLSFLFRSPFALRLRAIREDSLAAAALGLNTNAYKAGAFAISAAIAGLAGALMASMFSYINHDTFANLASITIVTIVITGGMGHLAGAILGTLLLLIIPEVLRFAPEARWLLYGCTMIVMVRFRPQGLLGSK